ncbi:MAG: hypothetical protein JSR72_13120 [Proteobacteria bacterium]|nr:hypothetical protein [Pseudomonadota bacterium]
MATVVLSLSAGVLAACQTDGGPTDPFTELAAYHARNQAPSPADKADEKPKSRAQAAMDCWALAEKTRASATLDAKADFVNACIDGKMPPSEARGTAAAKPKPAAKPKQNAAAKPPAS